MAEMEVAMMMAAEEVAVAVVMMMVMAMGVEGVMVVRERLQ